MRRGGPIRAARRDSDARLQGAHRRTATAHAIRARTICSPHGDRRMKLSNRKPLFLALALTFAAPLAFAQSRPDADDHDTQSTTHRRRPTQDATTTQSTSTPVDDDAATRCRRRTPATSRHPTQSSDHARQHRSASRPAGDPQKKNWSDLDVDKNGTLSATEAASVQQPVEGVRQGRRQRRRRADAGRIQGLPRRQRQGQGQVGFGRLITAIAAIAPGRSAQEARSATAAHDPAGPSGPAGSTPKAHSTRTTNERHASHH